MSGEPQPTTLELPVGREEVEQVRFREAGEFQRDCQIWLGMLTRPEFGEEDTRHTQGRDSSPSANKKHLCYPLAFVYIPRNSRIKESIKHTSSAMSCAVIRLRTVTNEQFVITTLTEHR